MIKKLSGIIMLLALIPISYHLLDKRISNWMSQMPAEILEIFEIITLFGSPLLIVACVAMLVRFFIQTKLRKKEFDSQLIYLFLPLTVISAWILSHFLKFLFGRFRPNLYHIDNLFGFTFFSFEHEMTSFPSGHTVLITTFILSLILFKPKLKWLGYFAILLVASSRIILDQHFLSDVIFGFIIGLSMVILSRYTYGRFGIEISPKKSIHKA